MEMKISKLPSPLTGWLLVAERKGFPGEFVEVVLSNQEMVKIIMTVGTTVYTKEETNQNLQEINDGKV